MKETQSQFKLPGVPQAKQGREVPQRWDWTEASVWTERTWETLARGIKGGWPKAYFADLGLISLALAHKEAIQSRKRTH